MPVRLLAIAFLAFGLAACGSGRTDRALSGGAIGAGLGAGAGAVTGGSILTGAVLGGAAGAATGVFVDDDDLDLDDMDWD